MHIKKRKPYAAIGAIGAGIAQISPDDFDYRTLMTRLAISAYLLHAFFLFVVSMKRKRDVALLGSDFDSNAVPPDGCDACAGSCGPESGDRAVIGDGDDDHGHGDDDDDDDDRDHGDDDDGDDDEDDDDDGNDDHIGLNALGPCRAELGNPTGTCGDAGDYIWIWSETFQARVLVPAREYTFLCCLQDSGDAGADASSDNKHREDGHDDDEVYDEGGDTDDPSGDDDSDCEGSDDDNNFSGREHS